MTGLRKSKGIAALILLDLILPGIDGFDLLRAFRKELKIEVPIIVYPIWETKMILTRDGGANDYLIKAHFTPTDVLERMKKFSQNMTVLDYIILAVLFIFVWLGFWSGFIRTLGSIVGLFWASPSPAIIMKNSPIFKFFLMVGVSQFSAFVVIIIIVSKLTESFLDY